MLTFYSFLFSQKGTGKYQFIDNELSDKSKTYLAGQMYYSMGFDLAYKTAKYINDASNKPDVVSCGDNILESFIYRDEKELKNVITLGMKLNENYNFLLSINPFTSSPVGSSAEISLFYIQDGMLYNYPNKNSETSLSAKIVRLEPYKDGTNNYLQKISFGDGGYLIMKDYSTVVQI